MAKVDANGMVTGVADGGIHDFATAMSGLTAYAKVTVGKGPRCSSPMARLPELNDRFQMEDGLYWKVIGPDSVQLLEDQNKASSWRPAMPASAAI